MQDRVGKYNRLPYLDAVNQRRIYCGVVNKIKIPLRNAVNECRTSEENMDELIGLLEDTLAHIKQGSKIKRKRAVKKKVEEEYSLPT